MNGFDLIEDENLRELTEATFNMMENLKDSGIIPNKQLMYTVKTLAVTLSFIEKQGLGEQFEKYLEEMQVVQEKSRKKMEYILEKNVCLCEPTEIN